MTKPTIKSLIARATVLSTVPAFVLSLSSCEVRKTEEGEMPEVKVEEGKLPAYEVEGPDVTIEEKKIEIPDSITVPDIDITTPAERTPEGMLETATPTPTPTPESEM